MGAARKHGFHARHAIDRPIKTVGNRCAGAETVRSRSPTRGSARRCAPSTRSSARGPRTAIPRPASRGPRSARNGPEIRRTTSLASGRTRRGSVSTDSSRPRTSPTSRTRSPTETSWLAPSWIVRPTASSRGGRGHEPGGGVRDEGEVAPRGERPEPERRAGQRLADDRRDDRARGLPRAVGVERPHDAGREVERAVVAVDQLVGGQLARGVRGLGLERMGLGIGTVWALP